MRLWFYERDIENLSKEELQDKLNEYIKLGFVAPDTTMMNVGIVKRCKEAQFAEAQRQLIDSLKLIWEMFDFGEATK